MPRIPPMPVSIYSVTLPSIRQQKAILQQPVSKEVVLVLTLHQPNAHPHPVPSLKPQPLSLWTELSWLLGKHMSSLQKSIG